MDTMNGWATVVLDNNFAYLSSKGKWSHSGFGTSNTTDLNVKRSEDQGLECPQAGKFETKNRFSFECS